MRRREYLSAIGVSSLGLTGCLSDSSPPQTQPEETKRRKRNQTTTTEKPTNTQTPTPDPLADATFIVDQSGSGDYKTLEEALRVSRAGDVIGLKAGQYTHPPEYKLEDLTLVGESREEVEVEFSPAEENYWSYQYKPFSALGLKGTGLGEIHAPTLQLHYNVKNISLQAVEEPQLLDFYGESLTDCTVNMFFYCIYATISNSRFEWPAVIKHSEADNCEFVTEGGGLGVIQSSVYDSEISLLSVSTNDYLDGHEVVRCEIKGANIGNGETYAIYGESPGAGTSIQYCNIGHRIGSDGGKKVAGFVGNTFESDGTVDTYFDGKHAHGFVGNAFMGGDVRITDSSVQMYNDHYGLGNFYSNFDGRDEDGDGILDLPRPLPGEGEVTDRYPLAKPNVKKYMEDIPDAKLSNLAHQH